MSWQVIFILPDVEIVPQKTFEGCTNIEVVVMSDFVRRIEKFAFLRCKRLELVIFSENLEFIGDGAFMDCDSLTSIFIPLSCREIGRKVFKNCNNLIILHIPQNMHIGKGIIQGTPLERLSPFETYSEYVKGVNKWIRQINKKPQYALHRACSSYCSSSIENRIHIIVMRQGLQAFGTQNEIGITPLQYLDANPYVDIDQIQVIRRYMVEMTTGEVV